MRTVAMPTKAPVHRGTQAAAVPLQCRSTWDHGRDIDRYLGGRKRSAKILIFLLSIWDEDDQKFVLIRCSTHVDFIRVIDLQMFRSLLNLARVCTQIIH